MNAGELPPPYTEEENRLRRLLAATRRVNAVAAIVADGHRHFLAQLAAAAERAGVPAGMADGVPVVGAVPIDLAGTMLNDVVAALGGETDPENFSLHPEVNSTHLAGIAHLRALPLEDR